MTVFVALCGFARQLARTAIVDLRRQTKSATEIVTSCYSPRGEWFPRRLPPRACSEAKGESCHDDNQRQKGRIGPRRWRELTWAVWRAPAESSRRRLR